LWLSVNGRRMSFGAKFGKAISFAVNVDIIEDMGIFFTW